MQWSNGWRPQWGGNGARHVPHVFPDFTGMLLSANECTALQASASVGCGCQQPTVETTGPCDVCSGLIVGDLEATLFVNGKNLTCQEAKDGAFTVSTCTSIQGTAQQACACQLNTIPCSGELCNICGDDRDLGPSNGLLLGLSNSQVLTCKQAQALGETGQMDTEYCQEIQKFANASCHCQDRIVTLRHLQGLVDW
jgi:hypothetical protein